MIGAFAEAVRATLQPCTLLLLVPALAVVVATRCRWWSLVAAAGAAVIGGWSLAAGWIVLDGFWLQWSAVFVLAVLLLAVLGPVRPRFGWAADARFEAPAVGGVTLLATLWWRPCVGTELGAILTASRGDLAGQLAGMAAYMLGALVPVALVVLLVRTIDLRGRRLTATAWAGGALGIVVAGALAVGRHDEVVGVLDRLTTG